MKNQLTSTQNIDLVSGKHVAKNAIVHTATSCGLVDNVFAKLEGEQSIVTADLIIKMHKAIQKAKSFIEGFEGDETQHGISELINELSQFDIE